ncbi:MAG: energy-dependent translational throttle protein EttA [Gemmatimonadota bacterium]
MALDTSKFIYVMKDLKKVVPPKQEVLKGIWLSFYPGAKIGVVGPNGAGKSTVLRIMAGIDQDFQGEAWAAKGVKVGYLPQEPELDPSLNVKGNVEEAVKAQRNVLRRYDEINAKFAEPMDADAMEALIAEQAKVQEQIDHQNLWDLDRKIEIAMDALRLPPADAEVTKLSGGEKRRVALCRVLLEQPDLLLLDEPTNHLDAFEGTIVAVTHDRYFLDNVAKWILELDRGAGYPYEGNYSSWLEQKKERLRREEKQESKRQKTLEHELEWIRLAPKARHAKGKARVNDYEALLNQDLTEKIRTAEFIIPKGPRLGTDVITAKGLTKGYGETLLIDGADFTIPAGAIVGVVGPNGAGKTTLFRMIVGQEQPDAGTLDVGKTVELAYVDQSRDALDAEKTVYEEISGGRDEVELGKAEVNARAYCSWFNFKGAEQQKKVGVLSGGERNRVHLAKLLKSGGNVILLDEPTNDLDVDTLRALEDALLDFAGCVLVISHDRWFLDRISTHTLAFEGDSQVFFYEGPWSEYEEDRKKRLGGEAEQPHRIRYRKLTRG